MKLCFFTAAAVLTFGYGTAHAFSGNEEGHLGITSDALRPMTRTINGRTYRFTDTAINQINDANRGTDLAFVHEASAHFDNETLDAGSARIIDLKEQAIGQLLSSPPNAVAARALFGSALHTAQDFYSHSNWIEMGNTTPEPSLGRGMLSPLSLSVATCPADPAALGGDGLTSLTTGYYELPNPCTSPPAGKCLHGVRFLCEGINKDNASRPLFAEARTVAIAASEDLAAQLLDDPRIAGNEAAIAAFMGSDSTLSGLLLAISSGVDAGDPRTFTFDVDSTISALTVEITGATATLIPPSGSSIAARAGANALTAPPSGTWRVEVAGNGRFDLRVRGTTEMALERFSFVALGGDLEHEGYVTLDRTPPKKTRALVLARTTGSPSSESYALIDTKGKIISTFGLAMTDPRAGSGERLGYIDVPNKPFRIMVSGTTSSGARYQRVTETLYTPGR